jgi:hypothetical protein
MNDDERMLETRGDIDYLEAVNGPSHPLAVGSRCDDGDVFPTCRTRSGRWDGFDRLFVEVVEGCCLL